MKRSTYLRTFVPRGEEPQPADREEYDERDEQHHDRDRRRARLVAALDVQEDEHGGDLGVEGLIAADQHDRPDLSDRARKGEGNAGEDAREDVREDDADEHAQLARAERSSRLFRLAFELEQDWLHRADDERKGDEEQGDENRRAGEREVDADRGARAVQGEQR